MFKALLEEPIILGRIVNDKLVDYGKDISWGLDETIAIFIRDTLRHLADTTNSYPDKYDDNWEMYKTTEEWEQRDKTKDYYSVWINHLKEIADKFDYYLKSTNELLSEEDREFLVQYRTKYPARFEPIGDGNSTLVDDAPKEENDKYKDIIINKYNAIEREQVRVLREALSDLGKIFTDLWD